MNHQNWQVFPFKIEERDRISATLNLHPLLTQLLLQRNLSQEDEIARFLSGGLSDIPNPFLLQDMDQAVVRLVKALGKKEKILFFGDYDVDGITGTAELQAFFREIGLPTEALLPHRLHDGYGLTEKSLKKIISHKPDLLVTIDNGTNAFNEIVTLKSHGIDVIVIDHHESPKMRPPVVALINPKAENPQFHERDIASAGLVFLLLMALRSRLREIGIASGLNLKRYLDLACLGTIADVVPLLGTNRILVKYGLQILSDTDRPGLKALKEVASATGPANSQTVAFRLAPRINAAGRLADPQLALDLLLATDEVRAKEIAEKLNRLNGERQAIEEKVLTEAVALVEKDQRDRKGLVVAGDGWHLGVVGIVAARLTEKYGRPAVVLAIEGSEARGSARTIPGFSVYEALKKSENLMLRFGGHAAAAGMTLETSRIPLFAQSFHEAVSEIWTKEILSPLQIDALIGLEEVNLSLLKNLALLEPYGAGNPEPLFATTEVKLQSCRIVGKNHLKATLAQRGALLDSIAFNRADYLETALKNKQHNISFSLHLNEWNGSETPQIKIKRIGPTL